MTWRLASAWLVIGLLLTSSQMLLRGSATEEEARLISILHSSASLSEKDGACTRLKRIGTEECVPVLAELLTHPELSHSARYALESLPFPEAGDALIKALPSASGLTKAGIASSLGVRKEKRAVNALRPLLQNSDDEIAIAAARALGQISTQAALEALQSALPKTNGRVREAVADASLACAHELARQQQSAKALPIFRSLAAESWPEHIRVAAYRGMFLAAGDDGLAEMTKALAGSPGPAQTAALGLVHVGPGPEVAGRISELLSNVSAALQVAIVEGLTQRGDASVLPVVQPLARSSVPEVRVAAIHALGILGESSVVSLLAEIAAESNGEEQAAAREALAQIRGEGVREAILNQLVSASPARQAELARALGERSETSAIPDLVRMAKDESGATAAAALEALALLATEEHLDALVRIVLAVSDPRTRRLAAETVNTAYQRALLRNGKVNSEPLLDGIRVGSPDARIALLPVCSGLANSRIRDTLRQLSSSADSKIAGAAVAAMCNSVDPELLPDITQLATDRTDARTRNRAISGSVRLWLQDEPARVSQVQRLASAQALCALTLNDDEIRRVLAGLAEMQDKQALALAERYLNNAAVLNEAGRAVVNLATTLPDTGISRSALKKVIDANPDSATKSAAESALKQVEARAAFIVAWQASGPFRIEGKNYAELFDIVFAPEKNLAEVSWQPLPVSLDPAKPFALDLLKMIGGEQCVAYARTWLYSPREQTGLLDLGSDDGIKVWLNGELVHANNTARPLQAGQDQARITLKIGWNPMILKVTQNNLGWEFCLRILNPDGSLIEGLRSSAAAPNY